MGKKLQIADLFCGAGGTSTGKTTLTNALLAEVAKTSDRVVLIEDTRELQCAAPNLVALRTIARREVARILRDLRFVCETYGLVIPASMSRRASPRSA